MDDILAQTEVQIREAKEKFPNPPCTNHPDRLASAFLMGADKKVSQALCMECMEKRLEVQSDRD